MHANINTLTLRLVRALALSSALIAGASAIAAPAPSTRDALPAVAAAVAIGTVAAKCAPPARSPASIGAGEQSAASQRSADGAATTVADLRHCYWACYPGSGCEYVCRFFPQ